MLYKLLQGAHYVHYLGLPRFSYINGQDLRLLPGDNIFKSLIPHFPSSHDLKK